MNKCFFLDFQIEHKRQLKAEEEKKFAPKKRKTNRDTLEGNLILTVRYFINFGFRYAF